MGVCCCGIECEVGATTTEAIEDLRKFAQVTFLELYPKAESLGELLLRSALTLPEQSGQLSVLLGA